MATNKQIRDASRAFDRADELVDELQLIKQKQQAELDDTNAKLTVAKADRDAKKATLKQLASEP